jgi:TolB-like protein/Flp pilus assembly protein TadD
MLFRIVVVYAAVAFVLWQAAEIAVPALNLPAWMLTFVVVATLAGFPIVVLLALAFQVTTTGKIVPLTREVVEAAPEGLRSVAVLPFANLSADPDNEYFSDGVTEDIITHLAKISGLKVISRASVMQYKSTERNLRQIGQELGVTTVIEGSVRRAGDRVRITAQLVDPWTDQHLWADNYDRELTDIFAIQSDVALRIADALKATLSPDVRARIQREPTHNLEAHNSYLLGTFYWNKRTGEGLQRAIDHFERAIELDPGYAIAYSGLADCYNLLPFYGDAHPGEAHPKARAAALKALELDDTLAEAHTSYAFVECWYDWDWSLAETAFERAIALNPSYAQAYHWHAWYLTARQQPHQAIARVTTALSLDPLSLIVNTDMGDLHYYARAYDKAIAQHEKTLQMDSTFWPAHVNLGRAYVQAGRIEEAIESLGTAIRLSKHHPSGIGMLGYAYAVSGRRDEALDTIEQLKELATRVNVPSYLLAVVYAGLGELDLAFEWLDRAHRQRDSAWLIYYLKADPWADNLRDDPRFADLLSRMALT